MGAENTWAHWLTHSKHAHACLFAQLCLTLLCDQALLCMGFSWQEYWKRLPFPSPGDLPNPGMEPVSLASPALAGRFFTTEPPGNLTLNIPHS